MHETDESDAVIDFLDSELQPRPVRWRYIDLFLVRAEPSASGDQRVSVMQKIS